MRRLLGLALGVMVGCKAPVEAPEDLGEASRYLYANFDSETGEEIEAGLVTIEAYFAGIDLEGPVNDRAVTPPILTEEYWGGVEGNTDASTDDQIPVAVSGLSRHDLDTHIGLVAEDNFVCIESNTTKYAARTFETDVDCFVDGSCDRVHVVQETRKESLIASVWYDWYRDYRRLELEDGRTIMIVRGWQDQAWPTDNGNGSWEQSYALDLYVPHADDESKTAHYAVVWSSVDLAAIGDDAWASLVKSGLDEANDNADDFVDDEPCSNDRDATFERP